MDLRTLAAIAFAVSSTANPIWAKKSQPLPVGCETTPDVVVLHSPDGRATLEVRCGGANPARAGVGLRVTTGNRAPMSVVIATEADSFWRPQEVLWAPDSSAFLINGSESAYAGADFIVYQIVESLLTPVRITAAAQRDMVVTFPPCRTNPLRNCHEIQRDPEFNMSAIAWTRGAHAIVIFAEVPCSGTFSGIMCQAMGYEVEVPTGRILTRMSARQLKQRYQSQAAWDIKIPGKPRFAR